MSVIGITGSTDGTGAASRWAPRPASRTHSGAEELAAKARGGDVALVVGEPGCPNPVAQLVSAPRRARPSRPIRHTGIAAGHHDYPRTGAPRRDRGGDWVSPQPEAARLTRRTWFRA
jgi:hypothetical protein